MSEDMGNCTKIMYRGTNVCAKCGVNIISNAP